MSILNDTEYIRRRMREIASPPAERVAPTDCDGLLREGDARRIDGYTYVFTGGYWQLAAD